MRQAPFPSEGFSGAVRIGSESWAFGFADRAHEIPNTVETQFAIASGTKTLTALVALAVLPLDLRARELLGDDLPLVDDGVTVEHLLSHTSGIGDYYDETLHPDPEAYVLSVPAQALATTEDYLAVLDGHPQVFPPGERFAYCNGGYVVLALLAERATGAPFPELVQEHVCGPAGMVDTAFFRSDALPGRAALGYLEDGRTNVFHLPVRGSGDGGVYTTLADVERLWAFIPERMTRGERYGLGVWLDPVRLEGSDAGVSFRSVRGRYTVVSNTTGGAWPVCRFLERT